MKETLYEIAHSIEKHREKELQMRASNKAVGRLLCTVKSGNPQIKNIINKKFWITNFENTSGVGRGVDFKGQKHDVISGVKTTLTTDGHVIYKNTRLGRILSVNHSGSHTYISVTTYHKRYENEVSIFNKASYNVGESDISDISIHLTDDEREYVFQTLNSLLDLQSKEQDELIKAREEQEKLLKKQEEAREAALKAAEDEAQRLLAEQQEAKRKAAEEAEKIKLLEESLSRSQQEVEMAQAFIRTDYNLRSQHFLDEFQDKAKCSHLFDAIPMLINGGPGTGKTTTLIQRLRFLTSSVALKEADTNLSKEQIEKITDEDKMASNWIFFSPTMNLLQYLRRNMEEEGLVVKDSNTALIDSFRNNVFMQSYHLNNPDTNSPFCDCKKKYKQTPLILNLKGVIQRFEEFLVNSILQSLRVAAQLKTSDYSWHKKVLGIKAYCSTCDSVKSMDDLIRLFNSLQDSADTEDIKQIDKELKKLLHDSVLKLQVKVMGDEAMDQQLREWFDNCKKNKKGSTEEAEEDLDAADDDEDEEALSSQKDYEPFLHEKLKSLIMNLALMEVDSKQRLSKLNVELLEIVKDAIPENKDLKPIAERKWFLKKYAMLCKGLEINIFSKIPAVYKKFRKQILAENSSLYDLNVLAEISKSDNKHLHPDEQNLLLGFINETIISISKKYKQRFKSLKHKYVEAYKTNCKYIVAVDEVTDFTLLDLYFINSLRHYDTSSLTLCGDVMQGLNANGIDNWQKLRDDLLPNLDIFNLVISYRQLPTLLDVARAMYKDGVGEEPKYHSLKKRSPYERSPLAIISDDREEKLDWIAERIGDVYNAYAKKMPSVAIFVNDEENIDEFIEDLNDSDYIGTVKVTNCSGNRVLSSDSQVRVFKLSEVKGMEFEVVFFYDIDSIVSQRKSQLIRRYLYVGLSRATAFMGATFSKKEANEDILKYFTFDNENWKL